MSETMGGWLTPEFEAGGLRFRFNVVTWNDGVHIYLESPLQESGEWHWCAGPCHSKERGSYRPTSGGPGGTNWATRTVQRGEREAGQRWERKIVEAVERFRAEVVEYFALEASPRAAEMAAQEAAITALQNVALEHGWTKQHSPEGRP